MGDLGELVLESVRRRFEALRQLGDGALAQLDETDCQWSPDGEVNSVATIVKHLHGNMLSRWTDFLTADGEKPWRDRDGEFEPGPGVSKEAVMEMWQAGWQCCLSALSSLDPNNLAASVKIRGQSLSVFDALQRQLAHYAYHVGQIVWAGRARRGERWTSLSIARGQSRHYVPPQERRD